MGTSSSAESSRSVSLSPTASCSISPVSEGACSNSFEVISPLAEASPPPIISLRSRDVPRNPVLPVSDAAAYQAAPPHKVPEVSTPLNSIAVGAGAQPRPTCLGSYPCDTPVPIKSSPVPVVTVSPDDSTILPPIHKKRLVTGKDNLSTPSSDSEAQIVVKIGDNSLYTTGITTELMCDMTVVTSVPHHGNFIEHMLAKQSGMIDNVTVNVADHIISCHSFLYPSEVGGRMGLGIEVARDTFTCHDEAIAEADRATLTIHPLASRVIGHIDPGMFSSFMNGGVVSERFVVSAIQPKLRIAQPNPARFLAEYITSAIDICDNYLMYAKLFYNMFLLDLLATLNIPAAANVFPNAGAVEYVNLDDAALDYSNIAGPIQRGLKKKKGV